MFAPFDRLGPEASDVDGTGFGLALSKRLVELMGGTLRVQTELSKGSGRPGVIRWPTRNHLHSR